MSTVRRYLIALVVSAGSRCRVDAGAHGYVRAIPSGGVHAETVEGAEATCAVAMAMSSSAALAHPPEDFGTPLTSPWGMNFWFIKNFQTPANPYNPANTHLTSSDIAFWDDLAYVGDYGGFRIFDISKPEPTLVKDVRCYGPQARSVGVRHATATAKRTRSCCRSTASSPDRIAEPGR